MYTIQQPQTRTIIFYTHTHNKINADTNDLTNFHTPSGFYINDKIIDNNSNKAVLQKNLLFTIHKMQKYIA